VERELKLFSGMMAFLIAETRLAPHCGLELIVEPLSLAVLEWIA